jgi:ribose transport system substrate-binding protein
MILSFFYGYNTPRKLTINGPIQVILKSLEGPPMDFWDVVSSGIEEAAKEFGVQVEVSGPRFEKEINRQITIMNRVIEEKPPLIIIAASDYKRLVESVRRANDQDIPIISLDSGVDSTIPVSFIATDNIVAGKKAGREMSRLLEENRTKDIAIVSHIQETATAIERERGVREALAEQTITGTWFCDVEEDKAYRITLDLLKNENLGGIVALNEMATLGVARAIEEQKAQDRVIVVGFDNSVRELAYLEEGIIRATVVQHPYNMGYLTIKTAVEYLSGIRVESFIDTGSLLITKENMYQREYQELLFPFSHQD